MNESYAAKSRNVNTSKNKEIVYKEKTTIINVNTRNKKRNQSSNNYILIVSANTFGKCDCSSLRRMQKEKITITIKGNHDFVIYHEIRHIYEHFVIQTTEKEQKEDNERSTSVLQQNYGKLLHFVEYSKNK